MLIACWSVKGGCGTTVVAAALGLVLASATPRGATLVDLGGDLPAALGVPDSEGAGVGEWLAADADATPDALRRLAVEAAPGLRLVPRGKGPLRPAAGERLAAALLGEGHVVVDCGLAGAEPGLELAAAAGLSLLVLRPCYLALRRALAAPVRPSGVVLVQEQGRSLGRRDVEDVLGVPVRAEIAWDATVARAVDAGLLCAQLPRVLERALRRAA